MSCPNFYTLVRSYASRHAEQDEVIDDDLDGYLQEVPVPAARRAKEKALSWDYYESEEAPSSDVAMQDRFSEPEEEASGSAQYFLSNPAMAAHDWAELHEQDVPSPGDIDFVAPDGDVLPDDNSFAPDEEDVDGYDDELSNESEVNESDNLAASRLEQRPSQTNSRDSQTNESAANRAGDDQAERARASNVVNIPASQSAARAQNDGLEKESGQDVHDQTDQGAANRAGDDQAEQAQASNAVDMPASQSAARAQNDGLEKESGHAVQSRARADKMESPQARSQTESQRAGAKSSTTRLNTQGNSTKPPRNHPDCVDKPSKDHRERKTALSPRSRDGSRNPKHKVNGAGGKPKGRVKEISASSLKKRIDIERSPGVRAKLIRRYINVVVIALGHLADYGVTCITKGKNTFVGFKFNGKSYKLASGPKSSKEPTEGARPTGPLRGHKGLVEDEGKRPI
jgi:hypothetical protein